MYKITAVATLTVCAALLAPGAAGAHTGIKSRSPASGATVSRSLDAVSVTFEARIADGTLKVVNAGGRKVSRGDGRLVRERKLRAGLRDGLGAGRYTATVRWLSRDGHVLSSTWSFKLR
jgi:methionine-rich copper-binding protein CopC